MAALDINFGCCYSVLH